MSKKDKKETDKADDKGFFEEFIKPVTKKAFGNMRWKNLKSTFGNKRQRNLYIASFFVNPVALYFLTHNKYFILKLDLKLYGLVALAGYFFEKGTLQFMQENNGINIGFKKSPKNGCGNKYEKKLCNALKSMNIPCTIAKTVSNEFSTQIYILSDAQITAILSKEREIAKRMNLEGKNLSITIEKSYFVFDIRNSKQKTYYFDEYLAKVTEKQLKNKSLPFVLGIQQSTGKLIVEDLADMLSSLVAGARGNGKSCFVNNLIQSLMMLSKVDVISILADFKGNELNQYEDFENCIFISSHTKFSGILDELITEMESRYKKLGKLKSLKDYNEKHMDKLPYIIVVIDEMACISLCDSKISEEINTKLMDLLNRGRACGVIVVGAMQRPSSKQIDTNVRANLDAKIAFRVSDKKETIFTETPGAEKLNRGEFIVNAIGYSCERFQGLYIEDKKRNFVFEELEKKYANGGKKDDIIVNLNKQFCI